MDSSNKRKRHFMTEHSNTFGSAKVAQSFRHTGLEIIVALSNIKSFRKDFISTGYVTTIQDHKEVTGVYILLALIKFQIRR